MTKIKSQSLIILIIVLSLNISVVSLMIKDSAAIINPPTNREMDLNSVYYSDWNQNMTVGMDGSLLIVEEMTFYLGAGSYGYAFRSLKWQNFHDLNSWKIESGPGAPYITYYTAEKKGAYINFNWEWNRLSVPEGTEYTFILTYNVSSAMDLRGERDRVYWNVIGGEFEYFIYDIDAVVIFPKQYNISDVRSTTYYQGNTPGDDEGTVYNEDGKTKVAFHQNSVAPYESYTIDTDSPPAGIEMPFSWRVYLNQNWVVVFAIAFIPVFLYFLITFLVKGLDPRVKKIPALNDVYVKKCANCGFKDFRSVTFCPQCGESMKTVSEVGPPGDLTPAEVGVLLDEKFDKIDFVAEFFYLAEKGYLKIVQIPDEEEIYFQRTDKNQTYGGLSEFDREVLDFVERHSYDTLWYDEIAVEGETKKEKEVSIEVTSLSTIKVNIASLWNNKNSVYKKLSGGETRYFDSNPEKIKSKYFSRSIVIGVLGSIAFYFISELFHVGNLITAIIGIAAACLIGLILSTKMPKLTRFGAESKASWQSYLQIIRGEMLAFPDPYEQFNFSMDHFSYLLIDPRFDLPQHLKRISRKVKKNPPPANFRFITPYWYYYPRILYSPTGNITHRTLTGFDNIGRGFESIVSGISNLAESLPQAISSMSEGISSAISDMSESFTPPSSSGGSSGFGGGFSGGGGGGGGGGIG